MIRMSAIAAAVSLFASAALGQTPATPAQGPGENRSGSGSVQVPPGPVLSAEEIKERLQQEGYTEITDLVAQGPSYEAKAQKDGRRYNLTVDARTGAIRSRY
jgi:hypothetical protein